MATALPLPAESRGSAFGKTSLVFAGLTVLFPVMIMVFFGTKAANDTSDPTHVWAPLIFLLAGGVLSVMAAGFTSLIGSVAGGVGLARGEASPWRAVIGLIVNVPVMLFVAYLLVAVRSSNGG